MIIIPKHTLTNFYTNNRKRILLSNKGELFVMGSQTRPRLEFYGDERLSGGMRRSIYTPYRTRGAGEIYFTRNGFVKAFERNSTIRNYNPNIARKLGQPIVWVEGVNNSRFHNKLKSITNIQKHVRGQRNRKLFKKMKLNSQFTNKLNSIKNIQKHTRGYLTRKLLHNLKTKENLISLNNLPRGNVVRLKRAPGIHNYVSKNTLSNYYKFKGKSLKTNNTSNSNTGVLHPLTRAQIKFRNLKTVYNPYSK